MITITEQQIAALAPNPAASANGRKISQKGGFVRLERSEDDTFYLGECTGSGANNYITSADYFDPETPVFRCSCPSRQFPCKHSLALLYEIMAKKNFAITCIPEDILQKRLKKQERANRAEVTGEEGESVKKPAKVNAAARAKKMEKQLEGLAMTAKLVQELMNAGLGTMGGTVLATYRELGKQLGDYYLPGPQRLLNRLINEIAAFQMDGKETHYEEAVDTLEKMWALVKKSQGYLRKKLENGEMEPDDNLLYEELGGIWKLSELEAIGRCKRNVRLMQLAFWVQKDDARGEFIDTACWGDVDSGEVHYSYNYRPYKALKYVRQEDSVFGTARIPEVFYYPDEGNCRIRWESAEVRPMTPEELKQIRQLAAVELPTVMKEAKNLLKNALADRTVCRLVRFQRIGRAGNHLVMVDLAGNSIALGDVPGMEETTAYLEHLPDRSLLEDQTLLGAIWYDNSQKRMKLQPYSIVTKEAVIRLLY